MDHESPTHRHHRRALLRFFARRPEKTQVTLRLIGYPIGEHFLRR